LEEQPGTSFFNHKRNEEIFKELRVKPGDEKLRRCKSNWLRHVTGMNSSRMAKIMLNCRQNGRRLLGRPFKETIRDSRNSSIEAKLVTDDDDTNQGSD